MIDASTNISQDQFPPAELQEKLMIKNTFRHDITGLMACVMLLIFSPYGLAEEGNSPGEYLQPGDFTEDDYAMITDHKAEYNDCLNEKAAIAIENQTDPRQVVNTAMKACAGILEDLDRRMTARNVLPAFRQGYIRRVNTEGANTVLRAVMMAMANRESSGEK